MLCLLYSLRAPRLSLRLSDLCLLCRLCTTRTSSAAGAAQCHHEPRLRFPCASALPDYGKHALLVVRVDAHGVLYAASA